MFEDMVTEVVGLYFDPTDWAVVLLTCPPEVPSP
jgi:hypothetical protein